MSISTRELLFRGWAKLEGFAHGPKYGVYGHISGWTVTHCGHATALWPYYATDPAQPGRSVVTHNGYGFRHLADAVAAVEGVLAGRLVLTDARCTPSTLRILTINGREPWGKP